MAETSDTEDQMRLRYEAAERHLSHAVEVFEAFLDAMEQGEDIDPREIQRSTKGYLAALQTVMDSWGKVQDDSRRRHGVVHDYAVDLDAAEVEVRRLLDCLRTEGDAGEVSGEP